MSVVPFPRRNVRPHQPMPSSPIGGDVLVIDGEGGTFVVYDESPSGGSAGVHGEFEDHGEAMECARRIARQINARSLADISKGGAA